MDLERPFIYAETHAGYPAYCSPQKSADEFRSRACHITGNMPSGARLYCEALARNETKYLGSSALVADFLRRRDVPFKVVLHDKSEDVTEALREYHAPNSTIECSDGYEGVRSLASVSLVLIDPFTREEQVLQIIRYARENQFSLIAWMPLNGDTVNCRPSSNCRLYFEKLQSQGVSVFTTRHAYGWSGQMCGCMISCSPVFAEAVGSTFDGVTKLMGWTPIDDLTFSNRPV